MVNGSPTEEFLFYKGLKKGYPMMLYLCDIGVIQILTS